MQRSAGRSTNYILQFCNTPEILDRIELSRKRKHVLGLILTMLQNAVGDALNNAEWAFALAECVHIGGFAVGVGTIALVDFRMLNLGLRQETPARILRFTELWTVIALLFVGFSGVALFLSQPEIYRVNLIFPIKMYLLAAALIYNFTIHRKVAIMKDPSPALSKLVASVSLLLWVSVVFGGIFIGFLV